MMASTVYTSNIFKADQRQKTGGEKFTSFKTSGSNLTIDDVFVQPNGIVDLSNEFSNRSLIIPLVGAVDILVDGAIDKTILSEEVYDLSDLKKINIRNPFSSEVINFLTINLPGEMPEAAREITKFNLIEKNKLTGTSLYKNKINIGVFDSRTKGTFELTESNNHVMVYVINGSFEVEDRLTEHRDGLLLWDTQKIEFEALAESSILLIFQFKSEIKN